MRKIFYNYQKILGILPLILFGFFTSVEAQDVFEFKIQYMESNDSTWGVYVRPVSGFVAGSNDAVVGSGQITILMKNNGLDSIHNIQSVSGDWNTNYDFVKGPTEAPGISYLFVGLRDGDGILLEDAEETLLFTFQVPLGCPDSLGLFDNGTDPFVPPNSAGNNPGMDLSVFNSSTGAIHNWVANYSPLAFSCDDCDNDGIVDGVEDTNGNGIYDSPPDSSGICDVCDPLGVNMFSATLSGGDTLTMCGASGEDSVALFVNLTGGWSPFVVVYEGRNVTTNVTFRDSVTSYVSGDPIYVSPDTSTFFKIITIKDSPPINDQLVLFCEILPDSLFDTIRVTVEGPLTIDTDGDPDPVTACNLDTLGFGVHASNGGEGVIEYQWQLSSDNTNWSDVIDGTPYAFATTDSLIISNPLGLDGTYYRAKVFTPTCDTIYTASAQLGIDGPFIINVELQDESVCALEDPIYFNTETSVGQGVFSRRWQVSTDTGATWTDVTVAGIYSTNTTTALGGLGIQSIYYDTLFIDTASFNMDQWQYRIAAIGQNSVLCSEIYTDEATLTVEGRLFIDIDPVDVAICSDTVACFGVTARNESSTGLIQYQWFVKERGSSTWDVVANDGTYSGARSDTLCITNVLGRDSFFYKVEIQSTFCEIVTSDSAFLSVDGPISFVTNADDVTVCAEEDPNYFAYETYMGQGVLDTRWQVSTDTGQTWADVTVAGIYSSSRDSVDNPATGFEIAYYDTLFIDTATFDMDKWQYRVAAIGQNSNNCEDLYSTPVILTVEGKIAIDIQPVDVSICSDTAACFGVTVSNEASGTVQYQWYVQEKGSTTWDALSNDGTYAGSRSDTLCVTNVLGRDSFLYRVDVSTADCNIITSDSAILRVDGPIAFAIIPQDESVCALEDPIYFTSETTIGQGLLVTRWQVSTDTGQTWADVTIAGIYTASSNTTTNVNPLIEASVFDTLFIDTASFNMNKWQYRVGAIGQNSNNCEDAFSREATLTVEGRISITVEPTDVEICSDTAACFGVSVANEANQGNIQYQWYVKERGSSTWDVLSSSDGSYGGVRSDTMCVNFIIGRDSFLYRVGIQTSDCNEIFSDSAILRVDGPIEFITDPQDETICAVEDAIYFTSVSTIGQGIMNTRWQVSVDSGQAWADVDLLDPIYSATNRIIANGSALIDSTYFDTLFISASIAGMDGWRYRTIAAGDIGSGCDDVPSGDAILTVEGLISITVQPDSVTICSDTAACFGVSVANETTSGVIQYQWQVRPVGTSTWINLTSSGGNYGGVTSDTMCVNNVAGLDSFEYRVQIFTSMCNIVNSDPGLLQVDGPVEFIVDPQDESICAAEDPIFFTSEVTIGQGGLTTRWQVSTDTGQIWADVVVAGIYSISHTKEANVLASIDSTYYDTLFISAAIAGMDAWQYRIVANGNSGSSCGDIPSEEAILTINGPLNIDVPPANDTICSGKPTTFDVVVSNDASGDIKYQWQRLFAGLWVDLNPNSVYNGVTDSILSISDVAFALVGSEDSAFYRVGIYTSECNIVYSDSAQLRVEGPFVFGNLEDSPHDTTVCAGEQIIFRTNPGNDGFGTMQYEWQVALNGGGFQAIALEPSLAGSFTGEDSTVLTINPNLVQSALLDSSFFRLDITSGVCADETSSLRALLRVDGPLSFTDQPDDITNCADKGVIFAVQVANAGFGGTQSVIYRWQEYDASTMIWSNIQNTGVYNGASTDTLSIDLTSGLDQNQYRVIVHTSDCTRDTSNAATLTEDGTVSMVSDPEDVIICSGEMTSFTAISENSTGRGTERHMWQISTNNGIDWANITDYTGIYDTTNTAPALTASVSDSTVTTITTTLSISDVTGLQGYRYRAFSANGTCDTVFSQLAKLTVEGPFIVTLVGEHDPLSVCANIGTSVIATVTNLGAGLPLLRWQYKGPDSTDFADIPTSWGIFHGEETNGVGTKTLTIDSVLNHNGRENLLAGVDTLWSLDNYEFRIAITSDTCETSSYSDTFLLLIAADTIGRCDWDLDGETNTVDLDDDNDGLTDSIELYITTGFGSEPQDSVAQFDTDTNNNGVTDDEEDADEDTISNGEEVDDDDGDGLADGVNTSTGVFDGFPANPNALYEDPDDVFNGDPLDPCDPILSPSCIGIVIDVNVKLQGAMPSLGRDETDAVLMIDKLREDALIPAKSPYQAFEILDSLGTQVPAFVHFKRDSISDEISYLDSIDVFDADGRYGVSADNAVVDWVFIEIRSGLKLDSVISTRPALLQRDGDVRDVRAPGDSLRTDADGYAYLKFDSTLAGEYFVVVRHRNHLGVMTNKAGLLSPLVTKIDFTDPDFNALGIHSQRMNLDSTEQYMWSGDITSDRKVIYQGPGNDVDEMFFRVIADPENTDMLDNYIVPGYYRTDYNLDGQSIFQGPDNDRQMLIFQSILQFPDNKTKRLANYVILEQLP